MPTEPEPVTLAEIARRAAEVIDPSDEDADVADLLQQLEDDDEPVTGILRGVEERVAEAVGRIDPQAELPHIQMMGAVITYLAHRRDELSDVDTDVLRLAARVEYDGHPPPNVEAWLADQGIEA